MKDIYDLGGALTQKDFLSLIAILIVFIFLLNLNMKELINNINFFVASLNTYSNLLLSIITLVYVVLTFGILNYNKKQLVIFKKQVIPEIEIKVRDIKYYPQGKYGGVIIRASFYNRSGARGTISVPILRILKGEELLIQLLSYSFSKISLEGGDMTEYTTIVYSFEEPREDIIKAIKGKEVKYEIIYEDSMGRVNRRFLYFKFNKDLTIESL